MPPVLHPINGFGWLGTDPARRLARELLVELGIEDSQRRVFISHLLTDSLDGDGGVISGGDGIAGNDRTT